MTLVPTFCVGTFYLNTLYLPWSNIYDAGFTVITSALNHRQQKKGSAALLTRIHMQMNLTERYGNTTLITGACEGRGAALSALPAD